MSRETGVAVRRLKRIVLDLLARANYAVVHADELGRERQRTRELARDLYETHVKLAELERVRMDADQAVTSSVPGSSDQDVRPLARLTNDADFDKPSAI